MAVRVVINNSWGGFCFNDRGNQIFAQLGFDNPRSLPRHHPVLVAVVEEFGNSIAGSMCELYIHTLRRGNEYYIDEYDGSETVIEPGDINYTRVRDSELSVSDDILRQLDSISLDLDSESDGEHI